ncbi:MAG: hypothetical protein II886_09885 [Prevotella sp.]|nr:hypothetical protein [Prevotella sp.]
MNSSTFREKVLDLRPQYSDRYRSMIDAISNKLEKTGKGNVAQFGAYYQTYMYACIIGLRLGKPKYLEANEKSWEFALMNKWKPTQIRDYVIMMLFNRSKDYGYDWMDLEDASDETITAFLRTFEREMEGYANRGLEYINNLWVNQRVRFESPTIFVEILQELDNA